MESNQKDKKALAKAKLEARRLRVSNLRKRIAIFSASLTLLFSGLVVGLNGVPLIFGAGKATPTQVVKTDNPDQQVGASVVAFATDLVTNGDNGGSGSSSGAPVTTSQS